LGRIAALAFLLVTTLSCDQDVSHVLPRYSGAPGEVLCIMNDELYEGRAGDILHDYFSANHPLLPQAEPRFDLVQLNQSQVNSITRHHRNLLFVNLSSKIDTPRVEAERNRWASEQLVVEVYAGSISELDSLMQENGPSIIEKYNTYERNRLQSYYDFKEHSTIGETLLEDHELTVTVPNDCDIAINENRFVWIERQRQRSVGGTMHDVVEGLLIYHYPYTNDSAFTRSQILEVRDSVLQKHVPGPTTGSYMTTEYLLPPESKAINFRGGYAVVTRGLWRTEGAVMGGPFISLTTLDERNQRVVTAEGFVFAPKFDKREYLREVEAMVYSMEFPEGESGTIEQ